MSVSLPPPIIPEVSLAQPFRWIGAYQAENDCAYIEAHEAWRVLARERATLIIGFLDEPQWKAAVARMDDDAVAQILTRTQSVLTVALKGGALQP